MIVPAYPLRCLPRFRDYLWGGRNLETRLGKSLPPGEHWAESWEIVDHLEHHSLVINGPWAGLTLRELATRDPLWLLGPGHDSLPLMLKYLDCHQVLSVQVHPDDHYAGLLTPPDRGKTEAWYIIDREPGAVLYAGLKQGTCRAELEEAIDTGQIESLLHRVYPEPGDCIFIPAGTVHALGAGILVAEVQQASNTTFRLHDWNRSGPDGQSRPLHIQAALDVIDFAAGPRHPQPVHGPVHSGRERLVTCDKFCLDRLRGPGAASLATDGHFHLLTAPHGGVRLRGESFTEQLTIGDSVLLPAAHGDLTIELQTHGLLLDVYLPAT